MVAMSPSPQPRTLGSRNVLSTIPLVEGPGLLHVGLGRSGDLTCGRRHDPVSADQLARLEVASEDRGVLGPSLAGTFDVDLPVARRDPGDDLEGRCGRPSGPLGDHELGAVERVPDELGTLIAAPRLSEGLLVVSVLAKRERDPRPGHPRGIEDFDAGGYLERPPAIGVDGTGRPWGSLGHAGGERSEDCGFEECATLHEITLQRVRDAQESCPRQWQKGKRDSR
jgi:hypothetical protein